jgi:hypothetical protein
MNAVIKFTIGIVGIIFSIVIISTIIPTQIQQQQITNNLINSDKNQLNDASVNLINTCETDKSVEDLTMCKSGITDMKNKCQNVQYSSMPVCNDPRIDQFLSTVDSKIAYAQNVLSIDTTKLNAVYMKILDQCSIVNDSNSLSSCKTMIIQMRDNCNLMGRNADPACNDPRITQILNKQITQSSNVYDTASQNMESFINLCMIAQDSNTIQDCVTKARQMINLCQSTSVQACNDPRLEQIANMGQTTTTSGQVPVNATAFNNINNQMQNILNECTNNANSNTTLCINAINTIKQDCSNAMERTYSSYFPACNDPRLQ